jgi:hypothetical protein
MVLLPLICSCTPILTLIFKGDIVTSVCVQEERRGQELQGRLMQVMDCVKPRPQELEAPAAKNRNRGKERSFPK